MFSSLEMISLALFEIGPLGGWVMVAVLCCGDVLCSAGQLVLDVRRVPGELLS